MYVLNVFLNRSVINISHSSGLVLYLSYGIKNSTEGTLYSALPDEERVLLQPIPRHPLTNKILRSHRHSDRADVRLQEIDTVLIER